MDTNGTESIRCWRFSQETSLQHRQQKMKICMHSLERKYGLKLGRYWILASIQYQYWSEDFRFDFDILDIG